MVDDEEEGMTDDIGEVVQRFSKSVIPHRPKSRRGKMRDGSWTSVRRSLNLDRVG